MRIAIVHYTAPPIIGGVERIVAEQAAVLAKHGHQVTIVCGNEDARIADERVRVCHLSALRAQRSEASRSVGPRPTHGPGDASSPFTHAALQTEACNLLAEWRSEDRASPFLRIDEPIQRHGDALPHWQQNAVAYAITWRLADSIPAEQLEELKRERDVWLISHPRPWDDAAEAEYLQRFSQPLDEWLDAGMGGCVLRNPACQDAIAQVLMHDHGVTYDLACFAIMPNHVHVLCCLRPGTDLGHLMQQWKGISAKRINEVLGQSGPVWQRDYFDRIIRSPEHFSNAYSYTVRNPLAARLTSGDALVWSGLMNSAVARSAWGRGVPMPLGRPGAAAPVRFAPDSLTAEDGGDALGVLPTLLADHDVIIVHNLFTMPFNLPATRLLRQLAVEWNKVHWINWVHDVAAVNPNYAHLPWDDADHAMIRQPAPNCTNVAVSDIRRRQYLDLLRLPESACRVIPNGIDVRQIMGLSDRVSDLATELRLWDRECVLLHPARVLRRKNIELSIRVVKAMVDLGLDAVLLVTGAPDPHNADGVLYCKELFSMVAEHELQDAVLFLGEASAIHDDDVRSLYGIADAVLFPSHSEGFGLPILEAALHTVPVFCSDIPAHREVGQNTAQFFALDDAPADIALRITEHPLVTQRYVRRTTIAACMDWSAIYAQHLEDLLGA